MPLPIRPEESSVLCSGKAEQSDLRRSGRNCHQKRSRMGAQTRNIRRPDAREEYERRWESQRLPVRQIRVYRLVNTGRRSGQLDGTRKSQNRGQDLYD